jgi:spore germination protein GerM
VGFPVALCCIALLAAGCGVPFDGAPVALGGGVPAQLKGTTSTSTSVTTGTGGTKAVVAEVYYVKDSQLQQAVEDVFPPMTLARVLGALESGPGPSYEGGGFSTNLPVGSNLQPLGVTHDVAKIGLNSADLGLGLAQEILELGQIVYTVLGNHTEGAKSVQFFYNGSPVIVVNANGQTVSGPVTEGNYCVEFAGGCPRPPKPSTTTTTTKA